ncbi:hypothetical protein [Demequina gelatinilytica]|uniref:hypothetical protein n=1 Tax=Demequina gelatinilytica TaxID=1638980 RepID=UPI00078250C3|nr:hypothetical protein [Demequina gelatinilytica]
MTITVPYVDYDLGSVRETLAAIMTAKARITSGARELREHWDGLPTHLSGSPVALHEYYSAMDGKTKAADDVAEMLDKIWHALDDYADDAKEPLDNLVRLRDEVAAWQASRPLQVVSAPGTPLEDVWAAQAGYAPGSVCLAESPWTTWDRRKTALESEIATWASRYEDVAGTCAAALRRIKDPTLMWWWDHWSGGGAGGSASIFKRGDNSWYQGAGFGAFKDGYLTLVNRTYGYDSDGSRSVTDNGEEKSRDGKNDEMFGYGIQGVNVGGENTWGLQGAAEGSFGDRDGWHGEGDASYYVGAHVEGSAGANIEDGNLVIGAGGEATVGAHAEASGSVGYGIAHVGGAASATAGATAAARASLSAGKDGLKAAVGADAMAGAEASASATVGVSGVDGTVGVTGYAGAGVKANAEVDVSLDSVTVDVDLGVALGLGAGVKVSVDVDPREVVSDIGHYTGIHWWFD